MAMHQTLGELRGGQEATRQTVLDQAVSIARRMEDLKEEQFRRLSRVEASIALIMTRITLVETAVEVAGLRRTWRTPNRMILLKIGGFLATLVILTLGHLNVSELKQLLTNLSGLLLFWR